MNSFKDRRSVMMNPHVEFKKTAELTGTFICYDCRKFTLMKNMAKGRNGRDGTTANFRCKACFEARRQRIMEHTKRIRCRLRELSRR